MQSFIIQVTERRDWVEPDGSTLYDPESGGNVRLHIPGTESTRKARSSAASSSPTQYAFTELPSPFDGLGVIFNHTWVDTDAEFINPNSGVAFDVPGLSRNTTNAVIFYEKYKVSARVAWNKRESFLTVISSLRGNPQFTSDYWQLDAGFGYQVTEKISVVFEAINITDENVDQYNIVGPVSQLEADLLHLEQRAAHAGGCPRPTVGDGLVPSRVRARSPGTGRHARDALMASLSLVGDALVASRARIRTPPRATARVGDGRPQGSPLHPVSPFMHGRNPPDHDHIDSSLTL